MFRKIIIFRLPCHSNIVSDGKLFDKKNTKKVKFNEFNENKQENERVENAQTAKFSKKSSLMKRNSGATGLIDTIHATLLSRSTLSTLHARTNRRLKIKFKTNKTGNLTETNILERIAK